MKKANADFTKRKKEIEDYFDFLKVLDADDITLHYSITGTNKTKKIDDQLLKILKANGFLLIYNLVESACRNSLWEILTAIQQKKLSMKKLSDEMQFLWIKQRTQNLRDPKTKVETIDKQFLDIAKEVIKNTIIDFQDAINKIEDPDNSQLDLFGLSGNINATKIKDMATICGFRALLDPTKEKAGSDLEEIKKKRNHLAHGRITFAECGKDYSVIQMCKYKDNAIEYIEAVLNSIKKHLKTKNFKAPKIVAAA